MHGGAIANSHLPPRFKSEACQLFHISARSNLDEVDPVADTGDKPVPHLIGNSDEVRVGLERRNGEIGLFVELIPPKSGGSKGFLAEILAQSVEQAPV